jgi:hypothetical protein
MAQLKKMFQLNVWIWLSTLLCRTVETDTMGEPLWLSGKVME